MIHVLPIMNMLVYSYRRRPFLLEPKTKAGWMDTKISAVCTACKHYGETDSTPLVVALSQGRSTSHDAPEFNSVYA